MRPTSWTLSQGCHQFIQTQRSGNAFPHVSLIYRVDVEKCAWYINLVNAVKLKGPLNTLVRQFAQGAFASSLQTAAIYFPAIYSLSGKIFLNIFLKCIVNWQTQIYCYDEQLNLLDEQLCRVLEGFLRFHILETSNYVIIFQPFQSPPLPPPSLFCNDSNKIPNPSRLQKKKKKT